MRSSVYARLFDRLTDLIPNLSASRGGAVFFAPPRIKTDFAMYCHIAEEDGAMRVVEIANDNERSGSLVDAPRLRLRVDLDAKVAEVLEFENGKYHQFVYGTAVNPLRSSINMYVVNWLQVLVNYDLAFIPCDMPMAA